MCTGCAPVLVSHAGATLVWHSMWHSLRGGFVTECTRSGTHYYDQYVYTVLGLLSSLRLFSIRRGKRSYTTVTVWRIGFGRVGVRNLSTKCRTKGGGEHTGIGTGIYCAKCTK